MTEKHNFFKVEVVVFLKLTSWEMCAFVLIQEFQQEAMGHRLVPSKMNLISNNYSCLNAP